MTVKSMTGFGTATVETDAFLIKTEIKALNGKFLELKCRMPKWFQNKEIEIRNLLNNKIKRGTVTLNIYLTSKGVNNLSKVEINTSLAKEYKNKLEELSESLGSKREDFFSDIIRMPDVINTAETEFGEEEWKAVLQSCIKAFEDLDAFRSKEGNSLKLHLEDCVVEIHKNFEVVKGELQNRRDSLQDRIYNRVKENIEESLVDQARFEQELIYYLEKYDIAEEVQRLEGHIIHFRECLNGDGSGKKLGFIAQEMGREINTMGVKANFLPMQKATMNMKEWLEKIKEQVLNAL